MAPCRSVCRPYDRRREYPLWAQHLCLRVAARNRGGHRGGNRLGDQLHYHPETATMRGRSARSRRLRARSGSLGAYPGTSRGPTDRARVRFEGAPPHGGESRRAERLVLQCVRAWWRGASTGPPRVRGRHESPARCGRLYFRVGINRRTPPRRTMPRVRTNETPARSAGVGLRDARALGRRARRPAGLLRAGRDPLRSSGSRACIRTRSAQAPACTPRSVHRFAQVPSIASAPTSRKRIRPALPRGPRCGAFPR